ncbi:MAG: tetratricopeptide repeat protein [Candidatus Latescibacteria bacterium]|nr:tetratricopeptide repeat protein [Candidatus Latescibacterota bacterium]
MMDLMRRTPLALILLGGLLVFANTLDNSFHYDDSHSIVDNPHLRSLANVPRFFVDPGTFSVMPEARMYRPLLLVSYALNRAVGGEAVWGYHLVNLALHLANAWLVWLLGTRLVGRGAWVACLLFLLHPVVSEPVNYISSRSALLATFFYLLGLWWVVRAAAGEGGRLAPLWVALCFAAGLASKEIAFTLPLVAALYLYLLTPHRPWKLLALPAGMAVAYLLGTRAIVGKAVGEPVRDLSLQWATQLKAAVFYLWTLVQPVHLSVEPQFSVAAGWGEAAVLLALLAGVSVAVVLVRAGGPVALFCVGWAVLALLPAALVPLNVLVNENRLYLPLAALALGLGSLHRFLPQRQAWLLSLLPLVPLCLLRNAVWRDEVTLWADAVHKGPGMPRAHVNLGKAFLEAGEYQQAIAASRRALAIDPNLDRAHYNIGRAYQALDQQEEAIASYLRALEIRPDLIEARNNLGNAYLVQGHADAALAEYRQALAVYAHAQVYHNLGKAHLTLGNLDSAAVAFNQAIAMDPANPEPYRGLIKAYRTQPEQALRVAEEALARWPGERDFWLLKGEILAGQGREAEARQAYVQAGEGEAEVQLRQGDEARRQGRWAEALDRYEQALRGGRESGRVQNARGECLVQLGRLPEALEAFRRAALLEPQLAVAYANIGKANLRAERPLEAAAALEKAVELEPRQASFWNLLGAARAKAGKFEPALAAYRQVLQLQPENPQAWCDQGTALLHLGRIAEGLASYERYLALNPPDNQLTQQVRQQVDDLRRQLKR